VPEELGKRMRFVRDSKTLSEKKRDEMYDFVREHFTVGVGVVHSGTIDRMNILEATFLAMKEAVADLRRHATGDRDTMILLVDGNMTIPNLSLPQEAIVDGDALVRSIAAASIVAKVTRDRMMLEYDAAYPVYGFARHKGYGTKEHMDALRKHGACPIHRMSFKPVFYSVPENVNRNLLSRKGRQRSSGSFR
jgi:ribonuclease HII